MEGSKLKLTPSFLISLEPPKEFSDSGFLDTDGENASITPDQNASRRSVRIPVLAGDNTDFLNPRQDSPVSITRKKDVSNLVNHFTAGRDGASTRTGIQLQKDSSTTSYSDERLTEYSGSVGLKTIASSGSPVYYVLSWSLHLSFTQTLICLSFLPHTYVKLHNMHTNMPPLKQPPSPTTGSHDDIDENKSSSSISTKAGDMEKEDRATKSLLIQSTSIRKTGLATYF